MILAIRNFIKKPMVKDILIIATIGFLFFMYGNQNFTLYDESEALYSRVAQEMVQNQEYLTLTLNGANWYVHPPMYFWMVSQFCETFGWTEFNLRFLQGFFGILTIIATYLLGGVFFKRRIAFFGALVLGTSFYFYPMSHLAVFDNLLNFFMLFSLFCFFKAFYERDKINLWLPIAAVSTALAVLSKGPIGLVQQGMFILPFLIYKKDLKFFGQWIFLGSAALFFVIVAPWYTYQLMVNGKPFFDLALRDYTWYRFFGVVENQSGPWYYYFPVLLMFYPWIFYLPGVIAKSRNVMGDKKIKDFYVFSWMAMIITFLFFMAAQTKLPHYIILMFPFLSILTVDYLFNNWQTKATKIMTGVMVAFTGLLFMISLLIKIPAVAGLANHNLVWMFFLIPFIASVFYLIANFIRDFKTGLTIYIIGTFGFVVFLMTVFLPAVEGLKETPALIEIIKQEQAPYTLVHIKGYNPSLMYYLNTNVVHLKDVETQDISSLQGATKRYFVMPAGEEAEFKKLYPEARKIAKSGSKRLYAK
ncbi:glycosyltransferase family 39 protein [bacterium]|nr:glycosyltransferase family 39 protein [bacterium]